MKFVPLTIRAKPEALAITEDVERLVRAGIGLGAITVKETTVETPPPGAGLVTMTGNEPAVRMDALLTVADS